MIDAAIEAGVKLFIFSGLPSVKKQSGGKYSHVDYCKLPPNLNRLPLVTLTFSRK
jgi:NmrA-like family